jgi:hypothetical protein
MTYLGHGQLAPEKSKIRQVDLKRALEAFS